MLYDLAENKTVTDWLRGWGGFKVGLVLGAVIAAIWMPLVFTAPQVIEEGDLYDLSMTVHIPVFSFIGFGLVWGLLFKNVAGVTWALGIGLGVAATAGMVAGMDVSQGWGVDWGFGFKSFYTRVDVVPLGAANGTLAGLMFGGALGAMTALGSLLAMVVSMIYLRRHVAKPMRRVAPRLVSRLPGRVRNVVDPAYRHGLTR
ncbi:MAG: hypothetical protein OXG79_08900 [Chloroflexi bacterium]|nr:hypothetical protein [Chloroflexota bacterium]MCY4110551.1 hypothetical protein [Chloroflexota bacterium]